MTVIEVASFAAAIASLVLAIVAIVLSIVFYQMFSKLSESAKESAKDIGASVQKLEKLFDRLYADTFSMMKDTVSDMRKHAWGEATSETSNILEEADKKTEEKIKTLHDRMEKQVSQILQDQKITDGRVGQIGKELKQLIDKAIDDSRNVEHEVREETIRKQILDYIRKLRRSGRKVSAFELVNNLSQKVPFSNVIRELESMKKDGFIDWEGDTNLGPESVITIGEKAK